MSRVKVPEDEMVLAELIAAASAHGLTGCKGLRFEAESGQSLGDYAEPPGQATGAGTLSAPPEGTVRCCALGAQMLAGGRYKPIKSHHGNDALESFSPSETDNLRDWNIGAAFNQAMED